MYSWLLWNFLDQAGLDVDLCLQRLRKEASSLHSSFMISPGPLSFCSYWPPFLHVHQIASYPFLFAKQDCLRTQVNRPNAMLEVHCPLQVYQVVVVSLNLSLWF